MIYKCSCLLKDGTYREEEAYSYDEIDLNVLLKDAHKKGYITYPATFDIETTTINPNNDIDTPYAFMYIWQFCIKGTVIIGRTWHEWLTFLDKLVTVLDLNQEKKLVIYVHNLNYEFEFIRKFIALTKIFATAPHKVLRASNDYFEFRCSYILSNMNLRKFIENTPTAVHYKAVDDLNYRITRTPSTVLTPKELGYVYNDVKGLEEAILHLLEEDDLKTIPMTSTGYVRRDCRRAMQRNRKNKERFRETRLNASQFTLLQECFRGGNTASSRYYCNEIIEEVGSYDISSSYPYVMMACEFPMGGFKPYSVETVAELEKINSKTCTIGRYTFTNIKLKSSVSIPYVPLSKVNKCNKPVVFNGRVLEAEYIDISLTNIDYDIIKQQYTYDDIYVRDLESASKARLPKELRDQIMDYYAKKTTLKGNEEHYYEYMKAKNKLNGIYGMTVTNPCKGETVIDENGEWHEVVADIDELLNKFYKARNSFLSYQWGVFVTAYARQRLQQGLDTVGLDVVYCDTDSVKYVGDHDADFKRLNDLIPEAFIASNNGVDYPLGVWDSENQKGKSYCYESFITLGAKKYAYIKDGHIGITVAGLSKKEGAKELEAKGGLKAFHDGQIFLNSGRTVAYFNNAERHWIEVNGEKIETGSNIAIVDTTYTLGISDTMLDIIKSIKKEEKTNECDY